MFDFFFFINVNYPTTRRKCRPSNHILSRRIARRVIKSEINKLIRRVMVNVFQFRMRLVGADFIHPMPGGAKIVGNLFYRALLDSYNKFKTERLNEGFDENAVAGKAEPNLRR